MLAATSPFVKRRRLAGVVAVLAVLASAGLCAAALVEAHGDTLVVWFGGWEPRAGVAVGIDFAVDPIGAAMALFVAVLGVAALVMCIEVIQVEDNLFDAIALVFIAAMVGFCLTGDLFNLFVFFELMSVCAYVLVGYEIRKRAPLEGSLTFAITNSIGSILLLCGIALLYGRTGALNLAQMGRALAEGPADGLVVVVLRARGRRPAREGRGGAVPLLDRGRLRGRADAGRPAARRRVLGARAVRARAGAVDGVPRGARAPRGGAARDPRRPRRADGDRRRGHVRGAAPPQADAGVRDDLARRPVPRRDRAARRRRPRRGGDLDRRRRARQGGAVRVGRPAQRPVRDGRGGGVARARTRDRRDRRAVLRGRARRRVAAAVRPLPRQDARRGRRVRPPAMRGCPR